MISPGWPQGTPSEWEPQTSGLLSKDVAEIWDYVI